MPRSAAGSRRPEQHFARALSAAIQSQGLTLGQVSARLKAAGVPTSVATLSYWQNGRAIPTRGRSLAAVTVLESILKCTPGSLTRALDGDPGEQPARKPAASGDTNISEIMAEWRLVLGDMHTHRALQERWTLSADRRRIVETSRAVSQVTAESQSAFPVVLHDGEGHAPTPILRCVHGCRLGRSMEAQQSGLFVGEVLLPRTFQRGESYWTELEFDWGVSEVPHRIAAFGIRPNLTVLTLDLVFEGEAPDKVTFGHRDAGTEDELLREVPVLENQARVALMAPAAGGYWFEW